MEKIISFSLWGTRDLYLHGALVNATLTARYFPDWKVRIYHDDTVPEHILQKLRVYKHITTIKVSDGSYGMFWRFEPLFENAIVLVRDLDSRITWRDVQCVNEWLESGKKLSVIRDHDEHYKVPIPGGLMGLRGPLPHYMEKSMRDYAQVKQYNMDQIWLAQNVWPVYQYDVFQHAFRHVPWMLDSWNENTHMGRGFTVNETPRTDHGAS
jgi:hypothetical protein